MNYSTDLSINQEKSTAGRGFFNHLITRLPNLSLGWNSKEDFNIRIPSHAKMVLKHFKWVEYNQAWVNMLIFDIDRPMSLEDGIKLCLDLEFEPTWICKTDRGIHIAYTLENSVSYEWKKAIKLARLIKERLTTLLKADVNGSHKLKGVWRNPLLHEHYFSGLTYSLEDFKYLLNKQDTIQRKFKKHIIKQKVDSNTLVYKQGYRNDYLWRTAMQQTRDKGNSYEDTYELINDLNTFESLSTGVEKIEPTEIERIARSVHKYNEKDMNFIGGVDSKKDIRGAMGYEPIAKDGFVSKATHKQITKQRQRESALRTKGLDMTRVERAKANSVKREKEAKEKVQNAITGLMADSMFKKKNGSWNGKVIAEYLSMSEKTVRKHLKALTE